MSKICGTAGLGRACPTYAATIPCSHLTGGECGVKRGLLVLLLLLMCVTAAGCTFYFGGWGTSSGQVKEAVPGGAATPLPGVQITYTSVSDPDVVWHGMTGETGCWTTSWLKIDEYEVKFTHPDCEPLEMTVDIRDKGVDNPVPVPWVLLSPKGSGGGDK